MHFKDVFKQMTSEHLTLMYALQGCIQVNDLRASDTDISTKKEAAQDCTIQKQQQHPDPQRGEQPQQNEADAWVVARVQAAQPKGRSERCCIYMNAAYAARTASIMLDSISL